MSTREYIISLAQSEVGNDDPTEYFVESLGFCPANYRQIAYCGIFCLAILRKAGVTNLKWIISKGFLFNLKTTTDPQIGDICYYNKHQHHAFIESIDSDLLHIINGNGTGGKVTRSVCPKNCVSAFYSIESLLTND